MRKLANEELNRKSVEDFKHASKNPIVIVLDNVRSLNNIGSVFRTADAFLVEGIYLCGITGTPPNKEIQKTALGATESVEWKYYPSTMEAIQELRQNNYHCYAIEQVEGSLSLKGFQPPSTSKMAIVFGNEVKGVEHQVIENCDACIEIPQFGTKHSFNISVSVGIVLWDIVNKIN